jgi:hypothetical protein
MILLRIHLMNSPKVCAGSSPDISFIRSLDNCVDLIIVQHYSRDARKGIDCVDLLDIPSDHSLTSKA